MLNNTFISFSVQGFRCTSELLESLRLRQITQLIFLIQSPLPIDSVLQVQKRKVQISKVLIFLPLAWVDPLGKKNPQLNTSKSEVGPLIACTYPRVPGHKYHEKPRQRSSGADAIGRTRHLSRTSVQLQWIKGVYIPLHRKKVLTLQKLSQRRIFHYRRELWAYEVSRPEVTYRFYNTPKYIFQVFSVSTAIGV